MQEVTNIVNWFNSAYDIRENKEFAGTTEESGIKIEKKDGNRISIGRSGGDFEVQRKDQKGKFARQVLKGTELKPGSIIEFKAAPSMVLSESDL